VPAQVAAARRTIEQVAAEHDREIDPVHFGALIAYRVDDGEIPEALATVAKARNPGVAPEDIVPTKQDVAAAISRDVDEGVSKFVLIPTIEPPDWDEELADIAGLVKPLEN
jgi:alkanesulfonate monooxygenase SsuD/methylene tetrahydromethanopterin reductase-like flavin-dependent oxidoreductase (luciferase family)